MYSITENNNVKLVEEVTSRGLHVIDCLTKIYHPNIILTKYEPPTNFLMPLYRTTLADIPSDEVPKYIPKIVDALRYLNHNGFYHGNVNLENIYLDQDLNPILGGFEQVIYSPGKVDHILSYPVKVDDVMSPKTIQLNYNIKYFEPYELIRQHFKTYIVAIMDKECKAGRHWRYDLILLSIDIYMRSQFLSNNLDQVFNSSFNLASMFLNYPFSLDTSIQPFLHIEHLQGIIYINKYAKHCNSFTHLRCILNNLVLSHTPVYDTFNITRLNQILSESSNKSAEHNNLCMCGRS